ncbi:MAG: transposase [Candidatus Omnitrophota bacterium]
MPIVSRSFIDYGCYHIITRGNQKQKICISDEDFCRYLSIVKKAKKKYAISLYSYCIMPNHAHLLIECKQSCNMSKFMHWINRGYTSYFNAKYDKNGHLWQGRFKSKPILKGQYLIHCSNYIEANPVRAKIANDIAEYRWSSYRERCLLSRKFMLDEIKIDCREKQGVHV